MLEMKRTGLIPYLLTLTRQNIDRDEMESEKSQSVCKCIKNNDDKYDIHTVLVKSGNE